MKHKFWAVLIALLIVTPTVIAVTNYFSTKGSPVNENSVSSLKMTDLDGIEYQFNKSADELDLNNISTNMVAFFTDLNLNSTPEALPEPLRGREYYKVVFNNYGRDVEYKYYFTDSAALCYYTDQEENSFLMPPNHAAAFLTSLYGKSVFSNATLPKMTTPAGEIIDPVSLKWSYLSINDIYPVYTITDEKAETNTVYSIPEKLSVAFSIPTSSLEIQVSANGEEVYNGLEENLAFAQIPANTELSVTVNAKWYETQDRASEGEASYKFKCRITDKPTFYLGTNSDTILTGDFVTITALNTICDASEITFKSEPDISYTPIFINDGNVKRAIIPLALELNGGSYTFTLGADGVEDELELTLTKKTYSEKTENISSSALTEQSLMQYDEAMKSIYTNVTNEKLFDGEFIYPVESSVVSSGYGRPCKTAQGFAYTNKWVRVTAGSNNDVLAMNAGKVVYVGEQTMTGRVVVVDHGMGLMSTYANLTSTAVSVGDTVATGTKIGVYGASGYSDGQTHSVALTVNGIYVSPYEIWDTQGVIFTDK